MPPEPNIAEDAIFKSIGDLKKKIQLSGNGVREDKDKFYWPQNIMYYVL